MSLSLGFSAHRIVGLTLHVVYVKLSEMNILCEINEINKCACMGVCFHQADSKLREEEKRALRYLETRRDCNSVQAVSITQMYDVASCFADNLTGNSVKR